jgi:hypothetical protein
MVANAPISYHSANSLGSSREVVANAALELLHSQAWKGFGKNLHQGLRETPRVEALTWILETLGLKPLVLECDLLWGLSEESGIKPHQVTPKNSPLQVAIGSHKTL